MNWYGVKEWLVTISGLNMDALHVHAGIGCQIAAAMILRRPLKSPIPWLIVVAATGANEYYDLHYEVWPTRHAQIMESVKDGWNTMLLPTALFLLARFAPAVLVGRWQGNESRPLPQEE